MCIITRRKKLLSLIGWPPLSLREFEAASEAAAASGFRSAWFQLLECFIKS